MNDLDVPMNLMTLNSILYVLTTMAASPESKKYAFKTIAEAKKFNIEPCLSSFYYLLQIFCSDSMLIAVKYESNVLVTTIIFFFL